MYLPKQKLRPDKRPGGHASSPVSRGSACLVWCGMCGIGIRMAITYPALVRRAFTLFLSLVLSPVGAQEALPASLAASDVRFTRNADAVHLEVDMLTPVSLETAWQVLTDFQHTARFVPNLERSQVTERKGNRLRVEQQGRAFFGPFWVTFGSVREIELHAMREIRAHQITGTARSMSSVMRLSTVPDGTRLEYRADIISDTYLPPIVGPAAVRHETAEQFSAILREMSEREAAKERSGFRVQKRD